MTLPPPPTTEFGHLFHMRMTPPPPPATEFGHLFHMRRTTPPPRDQVLPSFSHADDPAPAPPPAKKFCHLFHMQGRNNSFLKYTEEHKCPARQNARPILESLPDAFFKVSKRGHVRVEEGIWSP